jgi:zinc transport system substrate-binding protein
MFSHYITKQLHKLTIISLLFFLISLECAAKPNTVLVSIKPLHSLISHITDGVNQTQLLLTQQQSPHHFQLRPSQKRMINEADLFFYSSDNLESFVPALKNTTENLSFIQLSKIPKLKTLPTRLFHSHASHESTGIDGHIWLSIENAKVIAQSVSDTLSQLSPENASRYEKNLQLLTVKLNQLQQKNMKLLAPYKNKHYLVYHDAYQYFEHENRLHGAHFITTNPEHSPGIKRIQELRKLINTENIHCIFYEPPNIPSLINTLTEDSSVKLASIDPAGSQISKGKQHYFQLLSQTAATLSHCLSN